MELREAIKVLDSDAHARDLDNDIRQYMPEPYRSQKHLSFPASITIAISAGRWGREALRSKNG